MSQKRAKRSDDVQQAALPIVEAARRALTSEVKSESAKRRSQRIGSAELEIRVREGRSSPRGRCYDLVLTIPSGQPRGDRSLFSPPRVQAVVSISGRARLTIDSLTDLVFEKLGPKLRCSPFGVQIPDVGKFLQELNSRTGVSVTRCAADVDDYKSAASLETTSVQVWPRDKTLASRRISPLDFEKFRRPWRQLSRGLWYVTKWFTVVFFIFYQGAIMHLRSIFILAVAVCVSALPGVSEAQLSKVCKTITKLNFLIKGELSTHITNPGPRANSITVVCTRSSCPSLLKAGKKNPMYYCDGSSAGHVGRYFPNFSGNGAARGYCGAGGAAPCNVRTMGTKMKQIARKKKCPSARNDMYMLLNAATKACVTFVPTARNGGL